MKLIRILIVSMVGLAVVSFAKVSLACGSYSVSSSSDDTEHHLYCDQFHFGSFIIDKAGNNLIFRPHPDKLDDNGWGTSWFMAPFLPGKYSTSGSGSVNSITATPAGINVSLSGLVANGAGGNFGNWNIVGTFAYDNLAEKITANGNLNLSLSGTLTAANSDLNLEKLSSNYLFNVPLQSGGFGNTGDMKQAIATYNYETSSPRSLVWIPPQQPSYYPTDASNSLGIEVLGQINNVDTKAQGKGFQIAIANKPTISVVYSSIAVPLSAGFAWDSSQGQEYSSDNIGINHLVLKQNSSATNMVFNFEMDAHVEPRHIISANLAHGSINVNTNDQLSVTVQLNGGESINADWWVVAATPWNVWYYYVYPNQWPISPDLSNISFAYQGPLFNLEPFEVLRITGLPIGSYTVYFGVDMNMNGLLDFDQLYYDSVQINVQ